jgi:ATP-binding cassette, subfamily C, bacterial
VTRARGRQSGEAGFWRFVGALARDRPRRFAWVIGVQVLAGLGQAISVLLLVALLGAVGVGVESGVASSIRDVFTSAGVRPTLVAVLTVYVFVTTLTSALNAYQSVLGTRYRLEYVDRLRGRLYAAVAHARWRHLMELRQSDLLTVLTNNVTWVGIGAAGALSVIVSAIVIAAQLAAATGISPPLTGLAIASGVGLVAAVWPLIRRSRRLGRQLMDANRGVMALATGFLDALKLTKAYGREAQHVSVFTSSLTRARGSQVEFARMSAVASAVQTILTAALLAVTVDVSIRYLHVPVGSLLVVAFVFTRVVGQVAGLQTGIQQVAQSVPAFEEVMSLIASCEAAEETTPSSRRTLRRVGIGEGVSLEEVDFAYPRREGGVEGEQALRGVSLEIPAGSMVALAGPSGAGKTTVADLVVGLISPTAGLVNVAGEPLTGERLLGWRSSVALVPQDPFLFHDTIRANLAWASPDASEAQLWAALSSAAADGFVSQLPGGLDAIVGDRGLRLSGGERQRLALARALLRDPELLVLDEATSSLDSVNELAIRTALAKLRGRTTILLIAHRLATAIDADQLVVLDAGRVVEAGTWAELSERAGGRLQGLIEAGLTAGRPDRSDASSR